MTTFPESAAATCAAGAILDPWIFSCILEPSLLRARLTRLHRLPYVTLNFFAASIVHPPAKTNARALFDASVATCGIARRDRPSIDNESTIDFLGTSTVKRLLGAAAGSYEHAVFYQLKP